MVTLLTQADIEMIKQTRAEVTHNRTVPIILFHEAINGEDPFTGDPTFGEVEELAKATWKTLISQSGGEGEIEYVNGTKTETDDVIVNLDIEYEMGDVSKVKNVRTGESYTIKAKDQLGLGEVNRHFVLLELIK